jgi:hypothetical protein
MSLLAFMLYSTCERHSVVTERQRIVTKYRLDVLHGDAGVAEAKDAVKVGDREDALGVVVGLSKDLSRDVQSIAEANAVIGQEAAEDAGAVADLEGGADLTVGEGAGGVVLALAGRRRRRCEEGRAMDRMDLLEETGTAQGAPETRRKYILGVDLIIRT